MVASVNQARRNGKTLAVPAFPHPIFALSLLERGRSSVVERQLPKLYVEGSIPFARSRFFKQLWTVDITSGSRQRERKGKSREQNGRLATKCPEKVPSCVPPMFLHPPGVRSRHSRANNSDSPLGVGL